ncbi:lipocalin family protein [Adhaeribacter aquaticus]|uniref:lipocalin family protein n=1 Tax=Adhaeribacter aquaticus TaxID=299567 RepID=UPI00041F975F|nr:lipocalin family protein [Adhaeribacter aquaticus]
MKISVLKNYLSLLTLVLFLLASCGGDKNTIGTAATISGSQNKLWIARKSIAADGQVRKMTKKERDEEIQFFANGSFSMRSAEQNTSGKWTFDPMIKNLTLQYVGSDAVKNFEVVKLNDKEMILRQEDGSSMELKAQ